MNGTSRREADPLALWAGWVLLTVAFVGSYTHVVDAVVAWGQVGWIAYAIAAMPEVTVFIGMRKVLSRSMTPIMWVFLASAGAFTLGGNLNSAQHTLGGYIAAGWPAWSAIGALIFAGVHSSKSDPEPEPETRTRTVAEVRIGRERVIQPKAPTARPVVTPAHEVHAMTSAEVVAEVVPDVTPVTPKALPAARSVDPEGDPVASALLGVWTPGQPLTGQVKTSVIQATGVSESTVKRTARALAVRAEVTS